MIARMLIPITVFVVVFTFVIVLIWIKSREARQRDKLRAEIYLKALEKGVEPPKEVIPDPPKKNYSLRTGVILTFVGIGICLFMYLSAPAGREIRMVAGGLVPLFLGLGFLAVYFIHRKLDIEDEE
ncbi:MAG: DUF6249 domain-containing protein [Rikenellaceae bacterium]|nr:DUF6249 domain-containing protein [Rikenellaceae bacterium]